MKKNFLTAAALMVTAFFVGTEIAQAADVTFGGQIRSRLEVNENNDFNDQTEADDLIATRVRLNANVNVNDSTSAFIQLQSSRNWGENLNSSAGNGFGPGGSGNASFTPSDSDASVGIHQAYFTLKNFASLPVDLQFGRQEVVLDGHRLLGSTGWTTGAQTHDAIRLTHKHGNHSLRYVYIIGNEGGNTGDADNSEDIEVHVLHGNVQGILGGNLSIYAIALLDGCGTGGNLNAGATVQTTVTCQGLQNDIYTIGARQAGQLFGIDYRGEYYYQGGSATGNAAANIADLGFTAGADIDRDAYMFGVRIGKKFNNVMMKPSITLWYDQLSGTDDSDVASNDWGTFNTLFDTGHKFYGHQDLFLNSITLGTEGLGLTDAAIKVSLEPMAGWKIKADFHWFGTDTDPNSNPVARGVSVNAGTDDDIGTELDIAIINKYNANTVISAGYSVFNTEELFNEQRSLAGHTAQWAYVQFDVKF